MLDREPFLKAIFAAPGDDLPRLVFADYLDEHGDPDWAELIRVQCELAVLTSGDDRRTGLIRRELALVGRFGDGACVSVSSVEGGPYHRGFRRDSVIGVTAGQLASGDSFRQLAVSRRPEWYGANRLTVTDGTVTTPDQLYTALASPVTEHVTVLDLSGCTHEAFEFGDELITLGDGSEIWLSDFVVKPTITGRMVEQLCQMREARRVTELDLRTNNLDNDALRGLARSPHLSRLERLHLSDGNRFKGRVWQQVLDRFGPHCVQ